MINKKKYHISLMAKGLTKSVKVYYLCGRIVERPAEIPQMPRNHSGICKQCLKAAER